MRKLHKGLLIGGVSLAVLVPAGLVAADQIDMGNGHGRGNGSMNHECNGIGNGNRDGGQMGQHNGNGRMHGGNGGQSQSGTMNGNGGQGRSGG